MSKNINSYLPKCLQNIKDLQVSNSSIDNELESLQTSIDNINKEVIVSTASEYGIKRWETLLNINPMVNETLELRRFRVANILATKVPLTIRWLEQKLKTIINGEYGFTIDLNSENYTLVIRISAIDITIMSEIEKELKQVIPCNISLEIGGGAIELSNVVWGTMMHLGYYYRIGSNYEV